MTRRFTLATGVKPFFEKSSFGFYCLYPIWCTQRIQLRVNLPPSSNQREERKRERKIRNGRNWWGIGKSGEWVWPIKGKITIKHSIWFLSTSWRDELEHGMDPKSFDREEERRGEGKRTCNHVLQVTRVPGGKKELEEEESPLAFTIEIVPLFSHTDRI